MDTPITEIRVEYLKFDTQLIQNPDISGAEYQHGTLYHRQLRQYILQRDNRQCRYCGRPDTEKRKLELDHVIPESKGGPTVVGNLAAACHRCNQKKGDQAVELFLAKDPERLDDVRKQLKKVVPLTDAVQLNSVMPTVLETLKATGLTVTTTDGVTTSHARSLLGLQKSHVNDAACLNLPEQVTNLVAKTTILKRQGQHCRQSINCDEDGSPAGDEFPKYSRLPREKQGYTTPPAHSTGPRRLHGMESGDIVRIIRQNGQTSIGRATLKLKRKRIEIKGKPSVTAKASRANLCAHRQRWIISRHKDTTPLWKAQYEHSRLTDRKSNIQPPQSVTNLPT